MRSYRQYQPAPSQTTSSPAVHNPGGQTSTTHTTESVHHQVFPQYLDHWQPGPSFSRPSFVSRQPQLSEDPSRGPQTRTRLPVNLSFTDHAFLVSSLGGTHPTQYNQTAGRVHRHVGYPADNARSRPLPMPTPPVASQARPLSQTAPDSAQMPLGTGSPTSRPLPAAPTEILVGHDILPSRTKPASSEVTNFQQNQSLTVRDRILALQRQAGAQRSLQRRALPQSPTAPPDLSQLPSALLRKRGTLPEPPISNTRNTKACIANGLNPYGHSRPLSLDQLSLEVKVDEKSLLKQQPETTAELDSPNNVSVAATENYFPIKSGHKMVGKESSDCQVPGLFVTSSGPDSAERPNFAASTALSSDYDEDRDASSDVLGEATVACSTGKEIRHPISPLDPKPRQGGPRKMQSNRQCDNALASSSSLTSRVSKPSTRSSYSADQPKGPQSLTLRLAAMALEEEEKASKFKPASHRDALEDSPPRPLRPLSPAFSQVRFVTNRSNRSAPLGRKSPEIHVDSSDGEMGSSPRPVIPKITFGVDEDSESESSNDGRTVKPESPSITISEATPTIAISSSEPATMPSIMLALDNSRAQAPKHRAPGRAIIRKAGLHCGGCGESIVGRIVSAMGVRWHPSCFQCTVCGELLEHVSAYEHDGLPYCHLDYHENFAPQCFHCRTPIVDEQFITLDDPSLGKRTYHEQHFFCAECGDPFLGPSGVPDDDVGFTVFKGYAYCEVCHVRLRMPKCSKCKKSIRDGMRAVEALGGKWHQGCFACAGCDRPFDEPAFFQRGNKPFCEKCFSIIVKSEID